MKVLFREGITIRVLIAPAAARSTGLPQTSRSPRSPASASRTPALADLVPFVDWSPFFHAWELRGRYPQILDDATVGEKARELFVDAQALLGEIVDSRLLSARGA